jgi:hypothetical protein
MRKIDLFDFFAGQMQELALVDGNDLQMGLEQRIILRSQCGQETIASMLVLICTHIRLTLSTIPRWLVGPFGDVSPAIIPFCRRSGMGPSTTVSDGGNSGRIGRRPGAGRSPRCNARGCPRFAAGWSD